MAHFKKCKFCKGTHRLKRRAVACKRSHKMETWSV